MMTRKSIDTVLLSVGTDKLSYREWDWMKMLKPGYRRLFQVTAQVFHGVFAARRFFRHIHMPVIATGTQYQAAPLRVGGDVGEGRWQRDTFRPDAQ